MRTLLDLLGVALSALGARRLRTVLVTLGPAIGVAAVIGVLGLSASAKGDVRSALRALGTDLVVVQSPDPSGTARLNAEVPARLRGVSTVEGIAESSQLPGASVSIRRDTEGEISLAAAFVARTASPNLIEVARLELAWGRFLTATDEALAYPVAVAGANVAELFALIPGTPRVVFVNGEPYAVVGALQPNEVFRDLDSAVIVPAASARQRFGVDTAPTHVYVRVRDGTTRATADVLPVAATYGGPGSVVVSVPSDLLQARAQVDATFRAIVLGLGGLSLLVGGIGITNIMTVSVLQRSGEIGIRRALGHTRGLVAAQFLTEALCIGVLGAVAGCLFGVLFVAGAVRYQGWVLELNLLPIVLASLSAVAVSGIAGIYPSIRAARLEPLEALRRL